MLLGVSGALLGEPIKLRGDVRDIELNNAVIQQLVISHNAESEMWKERIRDLETGIAPATKDRWTPKDAASSHEALREWVDRNYHRKE